MPLFDHECKKCGVIEEHISSPDEVIKCEGCGSDMDKLFSGSFLIKEKYPLWVERFGDYQKRQEERGGKITVPHPSEIL